MKEKITYRWLVSADHVCLYEHGQIHAYDEAALRLALKAEIEANRPPHKCGFSFEKKRQLQLQKFQAGLELLLNQTQGGSQ
jgi:hypothetical protein